MEILLDSRATGLVMSLEFVRKYKFKKLERLIYLKVDSIFNYEEPIKHIVKIELFYKRHQERTEINMIKSQEWSIILGML